MSGALKVLYYARAGGGTPPAFAWLVEAGVSCVLQGVAPEVLRQTGARVAGSPTADAIVVDLGEASAATAKDILAALPRLSGRIFIVAGPATRGKAPAGTSVVDAKAIVTAVKALGSA